MSRPDDPSGRLVRGGEQRLRESGASMLERLPAADFPVVTVRLNLPVGDAQDQRSDALRLEDALCERLGAAEVVLPVSAVRELHEALPIADRDLTVVVRAPYDPGQMWEVTRVLPARAGASWYLAAIDLGSARVWGQLLDGETGKVLTTTVGDWAQLAGVDPADLPSAPRESDGGSRLVTAASAAIGAILEEMGERSGGGQGSIEQVVVAGESLLISMMLDPRGASNEGEARERLSGGTVILPVDRARLGSHVAPGAPVRALPATGSGIGGDVVGALVASGMANSSVTSLYVDLGSGGGMVVGDRERLIAGATGIRPVFEGEGLRHGMPAVSGAIVDVAIDPGSGEVEVATVDGSPPAGICGSGLIAALGQLVDQGVVRGDGTFDVSCGSPRLRSGETGMEYVLVAAASAATGSDIVLSQNEIMDVLYAKASVSAGMAALLEAASVTWDDVQRIIVAGAIGPYFDIGAATAVGLFPRFETGRFDFLGNGSLLGARAVGTSRRMGSRSEQVASFMQAVEVLDSPSFGRAYQRALALEAVEAR